MNSVTQHLSDSPTHRWGGISTLRGIVVVFAVLFTLGCAQYQLPAIDPSGSRIFQPGAMTRLLTPGTTTGTCLGLNPLRRNATPPNSAGTFQPAPFTPPQSLPGSTFPLPAGPTPLPNVPAPSYPVQPAFQHPADPPPCDGPANNKFQQVKHVIPKIDGKKTPGENGQIIMTPSRIVAPVGSEVIVLAGICGGDGYFVKNQPLEWMLSNNSVGQIIEVGGMNHPTFNKLVPPTSKKIDGQYAQGRTGLKNILLTRGTPTPADDIELVEGQTYISVASASPGTTYVTGVAPNAEGWDRRRASTIINWVDGQWSIPAPANATAGTVYPLTTVVNRSSDAGGVEGWNIRYQIVGGAPAEFAPAGSQTAEAKTDRDGRGTVQIRQVAGQFEPGTTQVRVDVVRPPVFGEPELVVESGITSVTWSAPALTIRAIGPRKADLGTPFNYRLEITNPGDQISRDVIVRTKDLDDAIEYISATPKPTEYGKQFEWRLGDIAPNSQPRIIDVQLKSQKRGNAGLCFEVASEVEGLRTEACAETEISAPCLALKIDGPTVARIGESVTYNLNVTNECDNPLENLQASIQYAPGLLIPGSSNPIGFNLRQLQFNETQTIPITFIAQAPGTQCFVVNITSQTESLPPVRQCLEVGDVTAEQLSSQIGLELSGGRPLSVGGTSIVVAKITNRGNTPLENPVLTTRASSSLLIYQLPQDLQFTPLDEKGEEVAIYLGRIQPRQSIEVPVDFQGQIVDANAVAEFTVTTPLGAKAADKISLRVEPTGSIRNPGANSGSQTGPDQPNFGDLGSGNSGAGSNIGIPSDATPGPGDLAVGVRTLVRNIQLQNSPQPIAGTPQESQIEFVVANNSRNVMRDVDITLLVPPSLRLVGFDRGATNLELVNRNDDYTQFYVRRALNLRAGEELRFVATVVGVQPGLADFGVQAVSLDSPGAIASDTVTVSQ